MRVRRDSTAFKKDKDNLPGYYLSTLSVDSMSPERWLEHIRGHWGGIEIRNHWRKDACLHEDKTRSRNPNTVAAMAMLRNCLLYFLSENPHTSNINAYTEAIAADSDMALEMIMRSS
ncbi:MAG: transposase [Planctomycetaceae bacterium]|nr:transposase [Planctomycetaceae bacterium]